MLKRLVEISRPVLWINTIGTTVMAMWLGGDLWRWDIIPFLIWVTFPFNLLIYGINDIFDQETDNINARKGGMEGQDFAFRGKANLYWRCPNQHPVYDLLRLYSSNCCDGLDFGLCAFLLLLLLATI